LSIKLNWAPFPEASVVSYNVFRSIIGFHFDKVPLSQLDGKTLSLKLNGELAAQVITFDAVDSIVDQINAVLTGGKAFESFDTNSVFVRSDLRQAPGSVEIVGGTALAEIDQIARVITEKSEDELIAEIPALLDPTETVVFEDKDGVLLDFYAISTIDDQGNESEKSVFKQPIEATGNLCILEGIVVDLQGVRIPDAEVIATLLTPPEAANKSPSLSNISVEPITVLSNDKGRFCIPLLQGALIELEIAKVGFTHNIRIPEKSFAFVNDLLEDKDYRYPLGHKGPA